MTSILPTLKLLADPTRLRLLLLLGEEELSVAEIQEILGMGQSRISTHLAQLKGARLVSNRRSGKHVYYKLEENAPFREIIAASAREIPESKGDRAALRLVLRKRQDRARLYFDQLAGKFGRAYCPGRSWKGLSFLLLSLMEPMVIADLGAGEGTFSQLLARRAKRVIAVDSSEKMVEFGAQLAKENGFANLEYRLGDLEAPPIEAASVDLVVLSQALHHAASPSRAMAAAHHILKPGGKVAILDLLAHSFEPAREMYADLWLGFSEVQMEALLREAGFENIDVAIVDREKEPPHFQTLLGVGQKAS